MLIAISFTILSLWVLLRPQALVSSMAEWRRVFGSVEPRSLGCASGRGRAARRYVVRIHFFWRSLDLTRAEKDGGFNGTKCWHNETRPLLVRLRKRQNPRALRMRGLSSLLKIDPKE